MNVLALRDEEDGPKLVSARSARPGAAWSLPRREVPLAFSQRRHPAADRSGQSEADPRGYDVYQSPLRVRDARTGRLRATFDGRFGWYATGGARWEDDDHFLAVARDPAYRSGDPTVRRSWVRCSVTTARARRPGPLETASSTSRRTARSSGSWRASCVD